MLIVADKNIPYLKGVAEQFGDVRYLAGNEFTKQSIKDADTLIVRTVTHFGKDILEGSKVKLICSATIGYDHIDTKYCDENEIVWKNAPGCNSGSVMQYVVSSLLVLSKHKKLSLQNSTIGIVGVGNVGKKIAKACSLLGMRVLLNDPPRQEQEQSGEFVDLDTIKKEADIITFHTPLIKEGKYRTYHLADDDFFNSLSKKPIIINSARGGIIQTEAIKRAIATNKISATVIDCWEKEPDIDREYLKMVDIATPHIAGYSADGKGNATRMSLENIATFWNLSSAPIANVKIPSVAESTINGSLLLDDIILKTYNPLSDYQSLINSPESFTTLRENYPLRREFNAYTVITDDVLKNELLCNLGFNIIKL